mgnify:CR=1 FL=1
MTDEHTDELLRLLALDSEPLALYATLHLGEARGDVVDGALRARLELRQEDGRWVIVDGLR